MPYRFSHRLKILDELYKSKIPLNIYEIDKRTGNGKTKNYKSTLRIVRVLEKNGFVETHKEKGKHDYVMVELTKDYRESHKSIKEARKQIIAHSLDPRYCTLSFLTDKDFLNTLKEFERLKLLKGINLEFTKEGKYLLGL